MVQSAGGGGGGSYSGSLSKSASKSSGKKNALSNAALQRVAQSAQAAAQSRDSVIPNDYVPSPQRPPGYIPGTPLAAYGGGGSGGGFRGSGGSGGGGGNALSAQLALIDQAIRNAQSEASSQREDFNLRGTAAKGDLSELYGTLLSQTQGINTGVNQVYDKASEAAEMGGQELIDAIVRRGENAVEGSKSTLADAGIVGVGQEGLSDNLAVSSDIARNLGHTVNSNFDLVSAAQQAIGGWNERGVRHEETRRKSDVDSAVMSMIAELDNNLQSFIQQQEGQRSQVRSSGGGGGSSGGGGGFRSSSSGPQLPGDAVAVSPQMAAQIAQQLMGGSGRTQQSTNRKPNAPKKKKESDKDWLGAAISMIPVAGTYINALRG